ATPSPEEALQQLVEMRQRLGQERFASLARQMGMPDELLDHIEQTVAETEGPRPGASGLLDASGQPISRASTGLVDASGRPITSAPSPDGRAGADEADEFGDENLLEAGEGDLDEESSRRLFQELVGVRMI